MSTVLDIELHKHIEPHDCRVHIQTMVEAGVPAEDVEHDPIIAALVERCSYDSKFFGMVFLADTFDGPTTYQHDDVWQRFDDETVPFTCACAWRGFGKTTLSITKAVKEICYRAQRFIVIVGKSHDYAAGITESVKSILISSPLIRFVYGNFKAKSYEGLDPQFSAKAWYASDPESAEPFCFVVPKGANQQIRGMNRYIRGKLQRPTLIIVDDLEDDDEVLNEELRKKLKEWFEGPLLKCVETKKQPGSRSFRWSLEQLRDGIAPWRIIYIDTLKHEASNMANILQQSRWVSVTHAQSECRKDGEHEEYYSLVPEIISHEHVRADVRAAKKNGTMDVYAREMMCLPQSPENANWTRADYKYYSDSKYHYFKKSPGLNFEPGIRRFIIVDPAKTSNPTSAYSAILVFAVDPARGRIYLRKLINERLKVADMYDRVFECCEEFNTTRVAVEVTGLNEHIQHNMEQAALSYGLTSLEFMWLEARSTPKAGDFGTGRESIKRARAAQMLPYYGRGEVYHDESFRDGPLEQQQLSYPRCSFWDAIDAHGYIPQVLMIDGVYFVHVEPKAEEKIVRFENYSQLGRRIAAGGWRSI